MFCCVVLLFCFSLIGCFSLRSASVAVRDVPFFAPCVARSCAFCFVFFGQWSGAWPVSTVQFVVRLL